MGKYDDIINLPHPEPHNRTRMSMHNRAAQFSPFAALTGHSDAIEETGRLVDKKIELAEDSITDVNRALMQIRDNINNQPQVVVTYFVPDYKKVGGKYVTSTVNVAKIDENNHSLVMTNGLNVAFHNILDIAVML